MDNVDFHCDPDQTVVLIEVEIEPNVKVKCVSMFCYMGDTLGAGGVWR